MPKVEVVADFAVVAGVVVADAGVEFLKVGVEQCELVCGSGGAGAGDCLQRVE